MRRPADIPVALSVAGSDSGGGAGIQADLKTFAALGVHGTTAITCVTAQNPAGVYGILPCPGPTVRLQLKAICDELAPAAAKSGMLYSAGIIDCVAGFFRRHPIPLVVDPVMVSTSGARLLKPAAVKTLCERLLPVALLATPNLDEAEILADQRLRTVEDLRAAARLIHRRFGCAVLVKGGHLRGGRTAVDIFYDGKQELLLQAPFVRGINTHGTGCTYSAAITGYLALGSSLPQAVGKAKEFITQAIARSRSVAGRAVLNSFWKR